MSNRYYNNDNLELEVDGVTYSISVNAHGTYSYRRATRYEPEESEFEIDDIDAVWKDEDGNVVEDTEEMYGALESYLEGSDGWEEEEPPEPDYDYYEEREMARWEAELDRYGL